MSDERLFPDTVFVQALLNRRDQYHDQARVLLLRVREAAEVWGAGFRTLLLEPQDQ